MQRLSQALGNVTVVQKGEQDVISDGGQGEWLRASRCVSASHAGHQPQEDLLFTHGHTRAHVHTYPPEKGLPGERVNHSFWKGHFCLVSRWFAKGRGSDACWSWSTPGIQGAVLSVLCKESPEQRLWAAGEPADPLPPHLRHRCSCLSLSLLPVVL